MVEVCYLSLFSYGEGHDDMGVVLEDVLDQVCFIGGKKEIG